MRYTRADGSEVRKNNKYTRWLLNPDGFDPDKLDVNEFDQGDGTFIAKIPKDRDRIRIQEDGSVCLVINRETDKETGEIREETVRIGRDISGIMRGMMHASENYHDYYDTKGRLYNDPLKNISSGQNESVGDCPEVTHGQNESVGDCPQVTHWVGS